MSMFKIESADKVNLVDCKTASEKMLTATGKIGSLSADRCAAGTPEEVREMDKPFSLKLKDFFIKHATTIAVTVTGTLASGLLLAIIKGWFHLT